MPKILNPVQMYMKIEAFGKPNTGKSTFAYSIVNVKPQTEEKNLIIVFTNESTYGQTLALFSAEKQKQFIVFQHRSLEEFEADWDEFLETYGVKTVQTKSGPVVDVSGVEKYIHAIIIDEAEFLYREGYVARHEHSLGEKKLEFKPSDYGVPRSWFMQQMMRMASLPCHFIAVSKVGEEYEATRYQRKDGSEGSLQFIKTGRDTYRLPDSFLYVPDLSVHLFTNVKPVKDEQTQEQLFDELGRERYQTTYWGEARKNKANREEDVVLQNPTVTRFIIKLNQIRKKVTIQ